MADPRMVFQAQLVPRRKRPAPPPERVNAFGYAIARVWAQLSKEALERKLDKDELALQGTLSNRVEYYRRIS